MIDSDVYEITEKAKFDTSTENSQYVIYYPSSGSDLNQFTDLRIHICGRDNYYLPHQAYLTFKGVLKKKAADTAFVGTEEITLANLAPLFLFSKIAWRIGDRDLETIDHPGQSISMLSHIMFTESYKNSDGLSQCWYPDDAKNNDSTLNKGFKARMNWIFTETTNKGSFVFRIPLKYIFGFCYDYDRTLYGYNHCLSFVRASDYFAICKKNSSVLDGKVELTSLTLHMPILTPSTGTRVRLLDIVKNNIDWCFWG